MNDEADRSNRPLNITNTNYLFNKYRRTWSVKDERLGKDVNRFGQTWGQVDLEIIAQVTVHTATPLQSLMLRLRAPTCFLQTERKDFKNSCYTFCALRKLNLVTFSELCVTVKKSAHSVPGQRQAYVNISTESPILL